MRIKQDENGSYMITDEAKHIDAKYDGYSLSGTGSRKYKSDIMNEIDLYKERSQAVDEALSELSPKQQEMFALSDVVSNWGSNSNYDLLDIEDLYEWQKNPIKYNKSLRDLSLYWYSQKGVLSEVYDLYKTLPTLDSSNQINDSNYDSYEDDNKKISKYDSGVKKIQIREMLFETALMGTLMTYRRGTKVNPFIQILDPDYYYPARIKNGRWEVDCDLSQFVDGTGQNKTSRNRPNNFNNLKPEAIHAKDELNSQPKEVQEAFEAWRKGKGRNNNNNLYALDMKRTGVVKNKSRQRERYGRPVGIAAFEDLLHKDLLKLAERAVVDKVIETLLIVKLGEEGKEGYHPTEAQAKKVYTSIKNVLNGATKDKGNKLVGLPYWANIEALKVDLGIFDNDKYAQIDQDILISLGVSGILNIGQGNNYSSGTINENIFYSKIFDILEQIEEEVYNVQYDQIVTKADTKFRKKFARTTTVDSNKKIEVYEKLIDKGGAIKPLFDEIGSDFDAYIKQVDYEKTQLGINDKFKPFQTSFTMTDKTNGAPQGENPDENKDANEQPRPSTEEVSE